MNKMKEFYTAIVCVCLLGFSLSATASNKVIEYEVTITNITSGQTFTPIMLATHQGSLSLFKVGTAVSPELATLAESGNIQPLVAALLATNRVTYTQSNGALLAPGKSVTLRIKAGKKERYFSIAAMLIPTNDAFFSLNRVRLPFHKAVHVAYAYDAGSEPNDELCVNIPGPVCGGIGGSPSASGEGFVHIHSGIHGIGDLRANIYDWRNPTAKIVVRRIR